MLKNCVIWTVGSDVFKGFEGCNTLDRGFEYQNNGSIGIRDSVAGKLKTGGFLDVWFVSKIGMAVSARPP